MQTVAQVASIVMAVLLLWAGLEKARSVSAVATMLRQLGAAHQLARRAAPALVVAEIVVAAGLIFRPDAVLVIGGVFALATSFAVAGLLGLTRDEAISCACFGPSSALYLGWRQVATFPLWLGALATLWIAPPPAPTLANGFAVLAAMALALAAVRTVPALRAVLGARGDRRSAQEMLRWLPD